MGRTLLLLVVGSSFCLSTLLATAAGSPRPAVEFPLPVDSYLDQQISSLFGKLTARIQREPLNKLNQHAIALRPPLLVGFFLAALVIHGGCQQWWIGPVLGSLSKWPLMLGATILTAFNDNAAITYLASLVPGFSDALKYVVMAGAVTGGGLTVIANSPNPAGQSILASRFGETGISPLYLFLGALVPTLICGAAFMLLP